MITAIEAEGLESLGFLDFMDYSPLFTENHDSVIANPMASVGGDSTLDLAAGGTGSAGGGAGGSGRRRSASGAGAAVPETSARRMLRKRRESADLMTAAIRDGQVKSGRRGSLVPIAAALTPEPKD